jgi:hypothetical protein
MEKRAQALVLVIVLILIIAIIGGVWFFYSSKDKTATSAKCGDGTCDNKEGINPKLCPQDCKQNQTPVQENKTSPLIADKHFGAHGGTSEQVGTYLNEIGVQFKREAGTESLIWEAIEPNLDGNYDFSSFEQAQQKYESLGLDVMITINSHNDKDLTTCGVLNNGEQNTGVYRTSNPCDWNKYEAFLREAIKRYGSRIKYWQVHNEPESGHYYYGTPENYAELLARSYKIIKAECPDCSVLAAGMNYCIKADPSQKQLNLNVNPDYYEEVLSTLKQRSDCSNGCFDIFDVHAGQGCAVSNINEVHTILESTYDAVSSSLSRYEFSGKPIWSTEFGPIGESLSSQNIGSILIKSYAVGLYSGFDKLFWRVYEAPSAIIANGQKTDSYYAYKNLINKIEGYTQIVKLSDSQYKFIMNGKNVYILWCDNKSCNLPSEITGNIKITSFDGNEQIKDANSLVITRQPVFVEQS